MFDADIYPFVLAAVALGVIVFAIGGLVSATSSGTQHRKRVARAVGRDSMHRSPRVVPVMATGLTGALRGVAATIGERLTIMSGGEARRSGEFLASAGFDGRDVVVIYAFVKTIVPSLCVIAGLIWIALFPSAGTSLILQLGLVAGFGLLLSKGTDILIGMRRNRRLSAIRNGLPDMLELFVIASEAGLGAQPSLERVARELKALHRDLAGELGRVLNELKVNNDRKKVFDDLAIRVPIVEIGQFTQTILQAERHGTPFSTAIRTLVREQRADRLFRVEEKAARLPVLMTIPLVFLIMPAVFVVLVGPAIISVLDNIIRGM